jgi:hypothetical protein
MRKVLNIANPPPPTKNRQELRMCFKTVIKLA